MTALDWLGVRGRPVPFVLAIGLALPFLGAPLLQDDVAHRVMLFEKLPGLAWGPADLYDFIGSTARPAAVLRVSGFVPWFAADDLKLRFFRPLSSALIAFDAHVFGERVWAARLHSLLWFLGVVAGAAALHRRFLPPAPAGLATLIFAASAGHLMPVGWLAARHALVGTAFALVSVWLHVRWREDGSSAARWLSMFAFVAGLLAGEIAVGAVALIGAWELLGRRGGIRRGIGGLAPFAVLTLVYLAFYVGAGYGVRSSGAYVDPRGGLEAAGLVLRHVLMLVAELVAATPSDTAGAGPVAAQRAMAVWGAVSVLIAMATLRRARAQVDEREMAALRWMPVAAAAAAFPGAFALIGGRVLTLALVPSSAVVALVLVAGASAVRSGRLSRPARLFVAVAVAGLAFGHLVTAPAFRVLLGAALSRLAVEQHAQAASAPSCAGILVIVAASDPVIATYVPATMTLDGRSPERLRVLSMAQADHRIENVTGTGFDLVTLDRHRTRTIWERLYRSGPLPAGTRVTIPSLDATVIEDRDGAPVRVRFDFGEPLTSPHLCFVAWRDGRIRRLDPPGPGGTIDLPHERGPMGW